MVSERPRLAGRRLLSLVDVLSPGARGGMELAVLGLSEQLAADGLTTITLFPETDDAATSLAPYGGPGRITATHPAVRHAALPRSGRDLLALRQVVAASGAGAVNLHTGLSWIRAKDVLAIRLAGWRRCVVSIHGGEPERSASQQRGTRLGAALADAVIVHSSGVREMVRATGVPANKIQLIHYGVPEPAVRPDRAAARAQLGLPADALIISTVARLVPRKGVGALIAAVAALPATAGTVLLAIGGDGPERAALEQQAAPLGGRVRFLGLLAEPALLYAASDLFALPSQGEAFGLVYIEAAHFGLPAVGLRAGGVPDAVVDGETGRLVPADNGPALTQALAELVAAPALRQQLGQAARQRALSEFTRARMAERYAAVLFPDAFRPPR